MSRWHRRPLLVAAVLGLGAAVAGAPVALADDEGEALLEESRALAAAADFSGVVVVEWNDNAGVHRERMLVRYENGVVQVEAARHVVGGGPGLLVGYGGRWMLLSEPAGVGEPPRAADKYRLVVRAGPAVAGRPTTIVEIQRPDSGAVVERRYLDERQGLLLRRETLDADGRVERSVSFLQVWGDADRAGLRIVETPPEGARREVTAEAVGHFGGPYRDPERAGDGFWLVGRFRRPGAVAHLLYSDGVFEVSVFEQPGSLDWEALPAGGAAAEVEGLAARRYPLPVGGALVWERAGMVYTSVGDAPPADIDKLAADVSGHRENGRLARLARLVLAPFRW